MFHFCTNYCLRAKKGKRRINRFVGANKSFPKNETKKYRWPKKQYMLFQKLSAPFFAKDKIGQICIFSFAAKKRISGQIVNRK